ncbi:DUF3651 domain containing protein [Trichuris trichiura]|uniref:DUF3651 domain containing protein n=1 Tax=Trichuris trichiura TaxID=36087 RepID=A0A077Z887_TRITR|nr:DUF3651 domain containing protein [Trichuris trichiura]
MLTNCFAVTLQKFGPITVLLVCRLHDMRISIGIAKSAKVRVHNPTSYAVRLDAISGSTVHFHCSFFENKVLEPGGSTTFEVAFLGFHQEHAIPAFFHSNVGGDGVSNPYRLQPFLGNRISLNGSLSRWVEMYNPYPVPLRVIEMYSSDSSLHLDLPVDCANNKASFWNIPPFRTKRLANARVIGSRVKNTSAFIRLKTDRTDAEPLLIPVEVEVTAETGIFPMVKAVDFGSVAQSGTSRWFDVNVFNTFSEPVWVTLARLTFSPASSCQDQCYVGFSLALLGLQVRPALTFASRLPRVVFPIRTNLVWPRLVKQEVVHFPLTAVGNFSLVHLLIRNPSSHPVAIQIIPLAIYPNTTALMKLFSDRLTDDVLMFSLRDSELYNAKQDSPVPRLRRELENIVGTTIPRFTLSFFLRPAMKLSLRVGFLPSDYQLRSSLLLIRNNLTGLEMLPLYGRGAKLELKIGNVLPQSNHLILFEIQEKHLLDCDILQTKLTYLCIWLFVQCFSFSGQNSGEMPLYVTNISINGYPCQNRGFRVANFGNVLVANPMHFFVSTRFYYVLVRGSAANCHPRLPLSFFIQTWCLSTKGRPDQMLLGLTASQLGTIVILLRRHRAWVGTCRVASCSTISFSFLMICVIASAYLEGDRSIECAFRQAEEQHPVPVLNVNLSEEKAAPKVDNELIASKIPSEASLIGSPKRQRDLNASSGLSQLLNNAIFNVLLSPCAKKGTAAEKAEYESVASSSDDCIPAASVSSDEHAPEKTTASTNRKSTEKRSKVIVKEEVEATCLL